MRSDATVIFWFGELAAEDLMEQHGSLSGDLLGSQTRTSDCLGAFRSRPNSRSGMVGARPVAER